MGAHMKTTIEIADSLLEDARKLAVRERTTLRALIEQGLRRLLAERSGKKPFRLRRVTFRGKGLQAGVADATWDRIRELAYEGRGA